MARILIVEDDDAMRGFLSTALSRTGHLVTATSSGEDALDHLHGATFDLLLVDVRMPRGNGVDFVRRARRCSGDLPVLFVTAYPGSALEAGDVMTRRTGVLPKPFRLNQLLADVERLLVPG